MDFKQLEYFLALSQHESISGTADLLHISQSALSKNIAKIESEVGVQLFDRHGNYIKLNDYGRTFAAYAAQSLAVYQKGVLTTKQIIYDIKGSIRISFHAFSDILTPVISEYSFLNPDVKFVISRRSGHGETASDEVDFLLCAGEESFSYLENSNNWVGTALFQEDSYFLISKRYREYPDGLTELSAADLKNDSFVTSTECSPLFTDLTYRVCQMSGFVPHVIFETNNFLLKARFVGEGRAIAMMPECCIKTARELYPDARAFAISGVDTTRTVYLLRRKKLLLSEAALDFWDFVLDHYHLEHDERD